MATEAPVNGNYAPSQSRTLESSEQGYPSHASNNSSASAGYVSSTAVPSIQPSANVGTSNLSKEEVGWFFVEQYYNTLSRTPDRLYLFYSKRSQFVYGVEEKKVPVCIGQKSINDYIKSLDFHDCKVRITNVDSQSSNQNIVIQVIGEISNKSAPHRKFVQTFLLAEQTNGYFVLNDIFRYITDESEELEGEEIQQQSSTNASVCQEPVATAVEAVEPNVDGNAENRTISVSPDAVVEEDKTYNVEEEPEEIKEEEANPPDAQDSDPAINGAPGFEPAEQGVTGEANLPDDSVSYEDLPKEEAEVPVVSEESTDAKKSEESELTSAVSTTTTSVVANAPAKTATHRTWAMAAAGNRIVTPVVSATVATTAGSQPKASVSSQSVSSAVPWTPSANTTPPAREISPATSQGEWQTAGGEHKKGQSRPQTQPPVPREQNNNAYIKNVYHQTMDSDLLMSTLSNYGEIIHFYVCSQRNCAFVTFATAAGFQAAVAANPHQIGSEQITVERRVRNQNYQYRNVRGRGGAENRSGNQRNFKDGGRGGYAPRGRGSMMSRGQGRVN